MQCNWSESLTDVRLGLSLGDSYSGISVRSSSAQSLREVGEERTEQEGTERGEIKGVGKQQK